VASYHAGHPADAREPRASRDNPAVALQRPHRLAIAGILLVALVVSAVVGQRIAVRQLRAGIEAALGPRASVGAVTIGLTGVELRDLRIRGVRGAWPAEDELRAQRVHLRPGLATLWSDGWHIANVRIDAAYVSLQRTRDGRLRLLPALLEQPPAPAKAGAQRAAVAVTVRHIELDDATVDFHDASVRQPAHRLQFDQLDAQVGPIVWPALDVPVQLDIEARLRGPQRDGRLAITGAVTPATRDGQLKADARGVDLVALQPYLLRVNEGGVRRGTLDLTLDARVKSQRLNAPGRLTLTGLELSAGGVLSTFAGVPRQAVIAAMSRDGRIEVAFTLEGRLDDPGFSLNENFATRLGGGLAEVLGVSLGGVVEGMSNVIKGLFGR
jgi:hypothetical protein